jgi:hypothetical protein
MPETVFMGEFPESEVVFVDRVGRLLMAGMSE